ncbi:MAG: sugar nucleotide-binding protein [bacterium]|nr:sugar nucleotide-binding protein [bacterium]
MGNKKEKLEIYGVGITGLIGSRIVELLGSRYEFKNLSLETGVDITKPETLEIISKATGKAVVLHLAAKADVDGCERDKELGKNGDAWKINVLGTQNVVNACQERGVKLIYISTDFVFDGQNPPVGGYSEEDIPNPVNWYAQTKYEGEKIVQRSTIPWLICRSAFPYRAKFEPKKDFVRAILARLELGEKVKAVNDQIVTPTFIDDIAAALDKLIEEEAEGSYHLVGSSFLTPYAAAQMVAQTFGLNPDLVEGVGGDEYFAGRARRPFKLLLRNDKIKKLGVRMATFEEGLGEVKRQIEKRSEI